MYVLVLFELNKDCRFGNFTVIYIFEMVFVCLCSWFDLQAHTCNEGNYASRGSQKDAAQGSPPP